MSRGLGWLVALTLTACGGTNHGTIGALLAQRADGTLLVRDAPIGLAAANAGVEAGDEILLIDGRDVRALSAEAIHQVLTGDVGSPVKLTLVRGERIVRVTLRRSPARAPRRAPNAGDAARGS